MNKIISMLILSFLAANSYADVACGYGWLESIRVDDATSDFRIRFISQESPNNGCIVQDATIEVRPNVEMIGDTGIVASIALTALTAGKKVWVRYDNTSNTKILHRLNIYRD
jgi:hypothetical protein